ncbi:MAG: hypothetical protein A2901_01110 [Elusimicrobia bacterium RIFCSPLOWO2_01_FULL_54_10]|nr:MAG: hypothetical protein A2901_01110 [Elusimicrobia bacterium RIFCSPLOWO2_01_FULL_54_10]
MNKTQVAVKSILDRLNRIKAGFSDCGIAIIGGNRTAGLYNDPLLQNIHKNRVISLFINIAHLKDDVNRWAKVSGIDSNKVEDFCTKSHAVNLVIKVADTAKHGLGGRSKNNSPLEYEIVLMVQSGEKPDPSDKITDLFWLVVDTHGEPHQSNLLLSKALCDWLLFMDNNNIDVKKWIETWEPKQLPKGWSHYKGMIPEGLMRKMKEDADARILSF